MEKKTKGKLTLNYRQERYLFISSKKISKPHSYLSAVIGSYSEAFRAG